MPEVSRFLGIVIAMSGKLPPRALGLVMERASQHKIELMADWHLARQQAELKRIAPLE
ncbi:MAG: DUF4160 domain-containing protein [Cytophagales bacterium]|nr:DUF4160 domain-containing protein [Cytophagales bacterium]